MRLISCRMRRERLIRHTGLPADICMLGNLINGFRPLLRFRQIKRRQCLVSRLAHTALEVHLARSRQLVSIRARIPFLKELKDPSG